MLDYKDILNNSRVLIICEEFVNATSHAKW